MTAFEKAYDLAMRTGIPGEIADIIIEFNFEDDEDEEDENA